MPIIKVKEIIGSSPISFEEALKEAIKYATEEKKNVTGAKILNQSVKIENGKIVEYKVNVNVAYLWEKKFHQK
jgi:flavin-binding protein dodecin